MPLGVETNPREYSLGDSAELYSYTLNEQEIPVDLADIDSVEYTIARPDGTQTTVAGAIQSDGAAFLRYLDTDIQGQYAVRVKYTFTSGQIRSDHFTFDVFDPFDPAPLSREEEIANAVWLRLEDCFDSEFGGPWLRDQTLRFFNKKKIAEFISEAVLEINAIPPTTELTIIDFTTPIPSVTTPNETVTDPSQAVIVYGTLLAVIRHLMRSYVEQPNVEGAQVVYENRRDYLERWRLIYDMEQQNFLRLVALWKRQFLQLFNSKLLVHSKAGRLYGPGVGMRTRNAIRGYY